MYNGLYMFKRFLMPLKVLPQLKIVYLQMSPFLLTDGFATICEKLLYTPFRQQHLKTIWQNVSMSPDMFDKLYKSLLKNMLKWSITRLRISSSLTYRWYARSWFRSYRNRN